MRFLTPIAIGAALVIGGVAWYLQRSSTSAPMRAKAVAVVEKEKKPVSVPSSSPPAPVPIARPTHLVPPINPNPLAPADFPSSVPQPASDPDPQEAIAQGKIRRMFSDFRTRMGENPVGSNEEITRALTGDNPKQLQLTPPEGSSINEKGELVDRWGTPYFFHQLSKDQMEIRSAGPDKQMWTADDIVTK